MSIYLKVEQKILDYDKLRSLLTHTWEYYGIVILIKRVIYNTLYSFSR